MNWIFGTALVCGHKWSIIKRQTTSCIEHTVNIAVIFNTIYYNDAGQSKLLFAHPSSAIRHQKPHLPLVSGWEITIFSNRTYCLKPVEPGGHSPYLSWPSGVSAHFSAYFGLGKSGVFHEQTYSLFIRPSSHISIPSSTAIHYYSNWILNVL